MKNLKLLRPKSVALLGVSLTAGLIYMASGCPEALAAPVKTEKLQKITKQQVVNTVVGLFPDVPNLSLTRQEKHQVKKIKKVLFTFEKVGDVSQDVAAMISAIPEDGIQLHDRLASGLGLANLSRKAVASAATKAAAEFVVRFNHAENLNGLYDVGSKKVRSVVDVFVADALLRNFGQPDSTGAVFAGVFHSGRGDSAFYSALGGAFDSRGGQLGPSGTYCGPQGCNAPPGGVIVGGPGGSYCGPQGCNGAPGGVIVGGPGGSYCGPQGCNGAPGGVIVGGPGGSYCGPQGCNGLPGGVIVGGPGGSYCGPQGCNVGPGGVIVGGPGGSYCGPQGCNGLPGGVIVGGPGGSYCGPQGCNGAPGGVIVGGPGGSYCGPQGCNVGPGGIIVGGPGGTNCGPNGCNVGPGGVIVGGTSSTISTQDRCLGLGYRWEGGSQPSCNCNFFCGKETPFTGTCPPVKDIPKNPPGPCGKDTPPVNPLGGAPWPVVP